jgi:hypothetical protein
MKTDPRRPVASVFIRGLFSICYQKLNGPADSGLLRLLDN